MRLHFTADDLRKVRIGSSFGPRAETTFWLEALRRGSAPVALGPQRGTMVDRLDVGAQAFKARLEDEQARLMRTMAEQGVDGLLATLHPALEWRSPVLHIGPERARGSASGGDDIELGGRGLIVAPSLSCPPGDPPSVSSPPGGEGPHLLLCPAFRDVADVRSIWRTSRREQQRRAGSLGALLGRTRAEVLISLGEEQATTSELARRRGMSPASASEHATVLRRAGLVQSRRDGGSVLHTITPLGRQLLDATAPTPLPTPTHGPAERLDWRSRSAGPLRQ